MRRLLNSALVLAPFALVGCGGETPPVNDTAPAPMPPSSPAPVDPGAPGLQPTHLLSNGRYTVALRASGAGVSRWRSFNVTRWRDDPLRDAFGTFFYVRDAGTDALTYGTSAVLYDFDAAGEFFWVVPADVALHPDPPTS